MQKLVPVSDVTRNKRKERNYDEYITAESLRDIPVNIHLQRVNGGPIHFIDNMEELNNAISDVKEDVAKIKKGIDSTYTRLSNNNLPMVERIADIEREADLLLIEIRNLQADKETTLDSILESVLNGSINVGESNPTSTNTQDTEGYYPKRKKVNKKLRTLYFKVSKLSHPDSLIGEDPKHIGNLSELFYVAKSAYTENNIEKLSSTYYEVLIYRLESGLASNVPKGFIQCIQDRLSVLSRELSDITSVPMFRIYKTMDTTERGADMLFKHMLHEKIEHNKGIVRHLHETLRKLKLKEENKIG